MKRNMLFMVATALGLCGVACGDHGDVAADDEVGDGDGDGEPGTTSIGDGEGDREGDREGDGDADADGERESEPGDADGERESEPSRACGAPAEHITCDAWGDAVTPLQAIGLNCPGTPNDSTRTVADSFTSPDDRAWRIATQYGTSGDWVPREGESLLVISTGRIPAPDTEGKIFNHGNDQANANPDNVQLPAPMSAAPGSNAGLGGTPFIGCDGLNDCSDSLAAQWQLGGGDANDLLWFDFAVAVPPLTTGWVLDLAYFSNEFPEYVNSTFNDVFVVWEVSESYVGNICFIDEQPCTVTALAEIAEAFSGAQEAAHPALAGTGTQGSGSTGGQTTGWVTLEGPAAPGETMALSFALFDMGDTAFDSVIVLDNWRWSCVGCVPSEVDSCGVRPQ